MPLLLTGKRGFSGKVGGFGREIYIYIRSKATGVELEDEGPCFFSLLTLNMGASKSRLSYMITKSILCTKKRGREIMPPKVPESLHLDSMRAGISREKVNSILLQISNCLSNGVCISSCLQQQQ